MRFSVILTSFRRPHLVQQAIRSVLTQSYDDLELIIVDDHSGMETWQSIDYACRDDIRALRLMTNVRDEDREKLCRYAVCINLGLEKASGDVITYLTDDDYYLPGRLERMAKLLENREIHCVYEDQWVARIEDNQEIWQHRRGTHGITIDLACRVDHNSFAHRKACLDLLEKPYWPEGREHWGAGDAAFFLKLTQHFYFHPIEEPGSVHRWHENNVQSRMIRGESPVYSEEL